MEDALREYLGLTVRKIATVLILVLMEDALRVQETMEVEIKDNVS